MSNLDEREFHRELRQINDRLMHMGLLAESAVGEAVRALADRDAEAAQKVIDGDHQIDELQMAIDQDCLRLIALQQPYAADLRFLIGAMKINASLERIGDHAVNIAERAQPMAAEPPLKPLVDIPRMAEVTRAMVRDGLNALMKRDQKLAVEVCARDDQVDQLRDQIIRELITYMAEDPASVSRGLSLILVSRDLERVGDHATNIGEDVVLIVRGTDIRHGEGGEPQS